MLHVFFCRCVGRGCIWREILWSFFKQALLLPNVCHRGSAMNFPVNIHEEGLGMQQQVSYGHLRAQRRCSISYTTFCSATLTPHQPLFLGKATYQLGKVSWLLLCSNMQSVAHQTTATKDATTEKGDLVSGSLCLLCRPNIMLSHPEHHNT